MEILLFFLRDNVLLCSPGWSWTRYPLALDSSVLGWWECTTMLGWKFTFFLLCYFLFVLFFTIGWGMDTNTRIIWIFFLYYRQLPSLLLLVGVHYSWPWLIVSKLLLPVIYLPSGDINNICYSHVWREIWIVVKRLNMW
jgi:hypothetical protein